MDLHHNIDREELRTTYMYTKARNSALVHTYVY